jgi:signal transduction histidine kinase
VNTLRTSLAWLASFRLRLLFRAAFLLLALAVVAMTVTVLQGEKQRSYDSYQTSVVRTKGQIVARLRHPSGQLALLNPPRAGESAAPGRPVMLPFSAIDFDDQSKVRNAVEMAGCLVQYPHYGSLCIAIGNNPWAGGFIYAAGTFASGPLVPHRIGDEILAGAHRLRVTASLRGQTYQWLAPFEPLGRGQSRADSQRGRLTGYVERDGPNYKGARPVREFRGWVWQDGRCVGDVTAANNDGCERKSFFSLRLPIAALRDALFLGRTPQWPPPDLDQFRVHIQVLPPDSEAPIFDSDAAGAALPFSLDDLADLLRPGETLVIRKAVGNEEIITLRGKDDSGEPASPLLTGLIRRLPVENHDVPIELGDDIATPMGSYHLHLTGDVRSVNKALSIVVSRVSWIVGAMLAAIGLAWLVIEIGLVRPIAHLTRRTRGLSQSVQGVQDAHDESGLQRYALADLRGRDELGLLASALDDLLRRVKEDALRERLRAEQEKDMWHAVGHEIMSPLQSLLALHGSEDDPSQRYIQRMQQAVRVLYGSASPSEAFQSSALNVQSIDIAAFVRNVAENAGVPDIRCAGAEAAMTVRADEFPLEDVFAHILKNADARRTPGTPISIVLHATEDSVNVTIRNHGPNIPEELIGRIFEYGVSDQAEAAANGNRGQGLFVAKTYMAKMGGTISARNEKDGVSFVLGLQRARG